MENLSFPIGKYEAKPFSEKQKEEWIIDIQFLPQHLENAINNLDEAQLNTPYRPGGWTVKQLVHHVADSHINSFTRFKLGLTENNPTIKPYEQDEWVKLADVQDVPVNVSLTLLHALHTRLTVLLKNIKGDEWERTVVHPEHGRQMSLWFLLGMYAWHSRHHTAQVTALRVRMGW
jgi:uncharacterized damage-inducible protein DinB